MSAESTGAAAAAPASRPARRFSCPTDPAHRGFYLRRQESNAFVVSADGRIAESETRNSYDVDGDGPVRCAECDALAQDATPSLDLVEDSAL